MLVRCIGLFLLVVLLVAGCGHPSGAPAHPFTGAAQLRAKLNAMSVPDRIAYIKKHHDAVRTLAGADGPTLKPEKSTKPTGAAKKTADK